MAASDPLRAYREKLKAVIDRTKDKAIERIIVPPANKMLATIRNRIQVDGKNSNGQKIGSYSTEPMYASAGQFDKRSAFKPGKKAHIEASTSIRINAKTLKVKRGKTIQNVVKQKMKTMYLVQGYKELRDIQGKPTDKVNLTYRGDLMASYQQQLTNNAVLQGLTSEFEALKREGLEKGTKYKKGYGDILKPMASEIAQYKKDVAEGEKQEIIKAFRNA